MTFDLRMVDIAVVRDLCERHHNYGSTGDVAVAAFAVFEASRPVAAFAWMPPPPGCAKSVCPEEPSAVLALSRMVAVPKAERALKHISKPLREQMKRRIDRTRWPVLVTFSDEGQGHTGYVYKCSGWTPTRREKAVTMNDEHGRRASRYANGVTGARELVRGDDTVIQRWEHWACEPGKVHEWMAAHGWRREETGRVWKSGTRARKWVRQSALALE